VIDGFYLIGSLAHVHCKSLVYGTKKKKLSKEELKAKARDYHQKRREKINNDPVLRAIEAEKERKKYEAKKKQKTS